MRTKHISISRLMDFMRCPRAYFENIMRAREKQSSEPEILGDVTHMLTAGEKPAEARDYIREKMPTAPVERQEEVLEVAVERAERAVEMSAPEVTNERREVQLMWQDPETGYRVYAKPDELFFFDEGRNGKTISVMQITDVKSAAEEVKSYHWRQVYLFGLIASLALKYHYAIKLVVRLAAPGIEQVRWFSQQETWRQLERLRATLREIDLAWQTRVFEEKPGGYCKDCPLLADCEKGREYLRQREEQQRLAELDGGDDGAQVRPLALPVLKRETQACA